MSLPGVVNLWLDTARLVVPRMWLSSNRVGEHLARNAIQGAVKAVWEGL